MLEIFSRNEAKSKNLPYYFTGNPCLRGHISKRRTYNGGCYQCLLDAVSSYVKNSPEARKKSQKKYRQNNQKKIKQINLSWRERNRKVYNQIAAKYKCKRNKALVKWADLSKIEKIYLNCPDGYEVNHTIPLQGKLVCGLHNEFNLQYLPVSENRSKSNKFDPLFIKP